MPGFDRLLLITLALALCVVVLGAYVRLSDAGLGCPDWPGCYGQLAVPHHDAAVQRAQDAFPHAPLEQAKAWKEMAHRYLAGMLGLFILALCVLAWHSRGRIARGLPTGLLLLVVFQAMLGMWTVTLLLKPVVVSAHLLGGMTTLALLAWLAHRRLGSIPSGHQPGLRTLRWWARLGLLLLAMQIFLGGWVSANYAALACGDFPTCRGSWWPDMDFASGFHMTRALGEGPDGAPLSLDALTAIHWSHRLGALATVLTLGGLAWQASRIPGLALAGGVLGSLVLLQAGLGIANVLLGLPLALAAAHNAGAALLLLSVVLLNSKTTVKSWR